MVLAVMPGTAAAEQKFAAKDGVVWIVKAEEPKRASEYDGGSSSTKFHVLRAGKEVFVFEAGSSNQMNPRILMDTSYAFALDDKNAVAATQTRTVISHEGKTDKTEVTTTVFSWNGTTYVAGKPVTKTTTAKSPY